MPGRFTGRNSPSTAYAMYSPMRYYDDVDGLWRGGQFWDSRAVGDVFDDPLADQALAPFLNPAKMNNGSKQEVIDEIKASEYGALFEQVWGAGSLENVEIAYDQVALSIAAFERTAQFAPFSSKYDVYLQDCLAAGGDKNDCAMGIGPQAQAAAEIFSLKEWQGLQLFMSENNNDGTLEPGEGAMCAACHSASWTQPLGNVVVPDWSPDGTVPPVFTDFTYDNLGIPKNEEFPLDGNPIDEGLGTILGDPNQSGKFKVMPLRNVQLTGPYGHNGLFKGLKEIIHFYNTRDVPGSLPQGQSWFAPEYRPNMNTVELGNLGLSDDDEDAIVAFMKTLTDGWAQ